MSSEQPRVIVGLDFGTSDSTFALAHRADIDKIYSNHDYPGAMNYDPSDKTLTASYYKQNADGVWEFKSWGHQARMEYVRDTYLHEKDPTRASVGAFCTRFKPPLAGRMGLSSAEPLPTGLSVNILVTDYLRAMGDLVLRTIRDLYGHSSMKNIQWIGGGRGSPHPLIVVLEPEAAFVDCSKVMSDERLEVGDKLLVVDISGDTVDIVVQEVVLVQNKQFGPRSYRVKEVTISSGDFRGGAILEMQFMAFLHNKIGPCLHEYIIKHPNLYSSTIKRWEQLKVYCDDSCTESFQYTLPANLIKEWERYDKRMGYPPKSDYDEVEISYKDMQSIFDPVIYEILRLVHNQLSEVGGVKVLIVVGALANVPYLMQRMKDTFSDHVQQIIRPNNSRLAVSRGAVALASHPSTISYHIRKKTYGLLPVEPFEQGVDPPESVPCNALMAKPLQSGGVAMAVGSTFCLLVAVLMTYSHNTLEFKFLIIGVPVAIGLIIVAFIILWLCWVRHPVYIFLSHRNVKNVKNFVSRLNDELVRKRWSSRSVKVFFDSEAVGQATDVARVILEELDRFDLGVVVVTREFFESRWCMTELIAFKEAHARRKDVKVWPLFYELRPEQVKELLDDGVWESKWVEFSKLKGHRLDLDKCREAARWLISFRGPLHFAQNESDGERYYIKTIMVEMETILKETRSLKAAWARVQRRPAPTQPRVVL